MGAVAAAIDRRTSPAVDDLRMLVVAGGPRWCAAIDLSTGAVHLARWSTPGPALAPFTVVTAEPAADQSDADPCRREDLVLAGPPVPAGRVSRRRAERWLRPLLHPEGQELLGSAAPDVAYWTLSADRPSVALVAPRPAPVVLGDRCHFRWGHARQTLPVLPAARRWSPPRPRRVLVALSGPRDGRCHKVVAALL